MTNDQVSVEEVQMLLGEKDILIYALRKQIALLQAELKKAQPEKTT